MAQLFRPQATRTMRAALLLAVLALVVASALAYAIPRSDRYWGVGVPAVQPVPFSHAHHVSGLGLDCRYCHSSVEHAASAGMPSAQTCMSCHAQIWTAAAVLAPVRQGYATGEPIPWRSVSRLPDWAFFHHGVHVARGVACETCHGRVDLMPRTVKRETLDMGWCLDCHRAPERHLRPPEAVFAMGWSPGMEPRAVTAHPPIEGVARAGLMDCSTCHR